MTTDVCVHHWVIESANGTYSTGACQICHATRKFRNSAPEEKWGKDGFRFTSEATRNKRQEGQQRRRDKERQVRQ